MGIFDKIFKKQEPQQTDKKLSKNVRHIVCLCYDAPYINSLKPQMQDFIINAERQRGSVITQTSRITFDSFYDNGDLEKPDMIRQKLQQIYCEVYEQSKMYELADITVPREIQQKDGHTLVKYFVLYEFGTKKEKKTKADKYALPENGHYVLICKECGEEIHIPAHIEHEGLVFDFDPKMGKLTCDYGGQYTCILDGMLWFFAVGTSEPANQTLHASFKDNMQLIHRHISTHHDVFYLMVLQEKTSCYYCYAKYNPRNCLTYRNGQIKGLDKLLKTVNVDGSSFDLSKAEIPGVSWPL